MSLILLFLSICNLVCMLCLIKHTDNAISSVKDDTWHIVNSATRHMWDEIEKLKEKIERSI